MKNIKPALVFISVLLAICLLPAAPSAAAQSNSDAAAKTAKTKQTSKKQTTSKTSNSKKTAAKKQSAAKQSKAVKRTAVKVSSKTKKNKIVHGKRIHANHVAAAAAHHAAHARPVASGSNGGLGLHSAHVLVQDQSTGKVLYEKRANEAASIASITKLMTAMVTLDARPDLNEVMTISEQDVDNMRHSRSRLPVGISLSREEMLRLAIMSSENRAASALSRYYPGGRSAFVRAMNTKALELGMFDTYFYDSTGLNAGNVSSARDLARMVAAAGEYPLIREISSTASRDVYIGRRLQHFNNTNALVRNSDWNIEVSKTGFINEAGKCIVMKAWINSKPTIIVLLDAGGSSARIADSVHIKNWLESPSYLTRQDVDVDIPPGGFE